MRKGIPSKEEIDKMNGIIRTDEKCPKCGESLYHYDGGDQGGVLHVYCKECNFERY